VAAYVIFQADVTDPEQYERYKARSGPVVSAAGGRFIVRGGEVDVLEGEAPSGRTVLIEFPDMASARAWYDGEQYSEARALRQDAARARVFIVDGVD